MLSFLRNVPIKRKVTLVILSSVMVTLVLSAITLVLFQWRNARKTIRRDLVALAEVIAANSSAAIAFQDTNAALSTLSALMAKRHITSASFHLPDTTEFAHHREVNRPSNRPARCFECHAPSGDLRPGTGTTLRTATLMDGFHRVGPHLVLVQPVLLDKRRIGSLRMVFNYDAMRQEIIRPFLLVLGAILLAALLPVAILSRLFQRIVSAPILQLASTARRVAQDQDFTVRAGLSGRDEVGALTQAFNQMLERIQHQDAALRDSESRYRLLFEQNPLPMFIYDAQTCALLAANHAAIRHYGLTLEDIPPMSFKDLEMPGGTAPAPADAKEEGDPVSATRHVWHKKKDGTLIEVELTSHPVDFAGRPARLALCLDITARRQAERQLATAFEDLEDRVRQRTAELEKAKVAAEAASEAKSRFLAMMSHEIRTPLNGVTGVLHLLPRQQLTPQQQQWVQMAHTSAETLMRVIDDILDFSKIEAGKLDLRPEPADLHALLKRIGDSMALKAADRGLQWTFHLDAGVPQVVMTDADRLAQLLGNLLNNAVKFTETGSVSLHVRRLTGPCSESRVRFEIIDTGPGLSPEQQMLLFQPFSQVDNSRTRRHGGTGLGLGICKQLVNLMGGTIGVESAIGKGSTFWMELPFTPASLDPSPPAGTPNDTPAELTDAQPMRGHVLLVEDNEINQELAKEMIEATGCTCACVDNGMRAVSAVFENAYELVFMDCMMPEMDGYQATQTIRAAEARLSLNGHRRHIPIIALTANAMKGDREQCLAAGMDDYLSKPLDPEQVMQAIRKWLPPRPPAGTTPTETQRI